SLDSSGWQTDRCSRRRRGAALVSLEVALNDLGWIGFRRVPSISNTRPPRTTRPVLSASARAGGALLLLLAVFNAGCARDAEPAQAPSWSEAQPANYAS